MTYQTPRQVTLKVDAGWDLGPADPHWFAVRALKACVLGVAGVFPGVRGTWWSSQDLS